MPEGLQRSRWPRYTETELLELCRVLREERLGGSDAPQISSLEKEWSQRIGAQYCCAVASGTAALHMALWGAGVEPGDEVLVPAYTFLSGALTVLHQGAVPVFVDVLPDSFNLDPAQIEQHITSRTRAIVPVHLGGLPADMDEINAIANRHGLVVIEDAAHAPGAIYRDRAVGSLGQAAAFSINGMKNLPAGEAGLFCTGDRRIWERLDGLWMRVHFEQPREELKYPPATLGYNYRCSVVLAALGRGQLALLDELNGTRRLLCEHLTDQLNQILGVIPPQVPPDRTHVYHLYRVRFDPQQAGLDTPPSEFRAKVVAALGAEGVLCRAWMNWIIPSLPLFTRPEEFEARHPWRRPWPPERSYRSEDYPQASRLVEQTSPDRHTAPFGATLVMEAPTAVSERIVDFMARGSAKCFRGWIR